MHVQSDTCVHTRMYVICARARFYSILNYDHTYWDVSETFMMVSCTTLRPTLDCCISVFFYKATLQNEINASGPAVSFSTSSFLDGRLQRIAVKLCTWVRFHFPGAIKVKKVRLSMLQWFMQTITLLYFRNVQTTFCFCFTMRDAKF